MATAMNGMQRMMIMTKDGNLSERKWLSLTQLTEYLSLSKESIYRMVYAKKIPTHRSGKRYLFDREEIDLWVKEQKS